MSIETSGIQRRHRLSSAVLRCAVTATLTLAVAPAFAVAAPAAASSAAQVGDASAAESPTSALPPASGDPVALVNPLIGTGSGGKVVGDVDTFPGAVMPLGMLSFSPTTKSRVPGGDYSYKDSTLAGFSLTHVSGPGCGAGGELPILPTVGALADDPGQIMAQFSHAHEQASLGLYQVTLDPGGVAPIHVRLSATLRTGIAEFRFPQSGNPSNKPMSNTSADPSTSPSSNSSGNASTRANVLFKVSQAQAPTAVAEVHLLNNHELAGLETSGHFCGTPGAATMYFVASFNRPFVGHGTWQGGGSSNNSSGTAGADSGAWVSFDTAGDPLVTLKVGISYVSLAGARANLATENPGWNLDEVAGKARKAWNGMLSRIAVQGGTHDAQVQFYTALYHVLLHPNVFSDADGKYIGFDDKVHPLEKGQKAQYANYSGWDIYRSEVPLLALIVPQETGDMMQSLVNDAAQGGWLPKWGYDNTYTGVMNGDAADPILAEAYVFGVRNFDAKGALKAMVKGATQIPDQKGQSWYEERPNLKAYLKLGYVPMDASMTLEYVLADFSIARLAQALGNTSVEQTFMARSANWQKLFDAKASYRGFTGYVEPRAADGSFPEGPAFDVRPKAFGQPGFQEGNTIQYTWMVPQDLRGLIAEMGGNAIAIKRLDTLFQQLNVGPDQPYYWAGNEPNLGIPWIYDYAGAPWKTQAIVHKLIARMYANNPGGEPGNDDLGAMSSWLVWADLGLYPATPGTEVLALGAPIFPRVTLRLPDQAPIVINAPGASQTSYVQSLKVDGRAWSKPWLPLSALRRSASGQAEGAGAKTLDFQLSSAPNLTWGVAGADAPPSYPANASGH